MPQALAESSVLKVPIGHGKTWTWVWRPCSCCSWQLFCPKTAWLSLGCSLSVSGTRAASHSFPCCPSGAGLAARCLQTALSHCAARLPRSRWTCSQTRRRRLVPLQNCKVEMSRGVASRGKAKRRQAATCREPVPPGEFLKPNIGTDKPLITCCSLLAHDSSALCHTPCPARKGKSPLGKAQSLPSAMKGAGADRLLPRHQRLRGQPWLKTTGHLTCWLSQVALKGDDSTLHAHSTG